MVKMAAAKVELDTITCFVAVRAITYNAAVACEKGSRWFHAMRLSVVIASVHSKLTMDTITFSAAVNACEKVGHWE